MYKYLIEWYDTFNTKWCPDKPIFGYFNNQTITFSYYNFLNYDDENGNNIPGAPVEDSLLDNEGAEDAVVPNS